MKVLALPVGQLETNCYLLCDVERKLCAVIDPGADADVILENVRGTMKRWRACVSLSGERP